MVPPFVGEAVKVIEPGPQTEVAVADTETEAVIFRFTDIAIAAEVSAEQTPELTTLRNHVVWVNGCGA